MRCRASLTRTVTDSVISYAHAKEMRSPRIIYENCPVLLLSVPSVQGRCARRASLTRTVTDSVISYVRDSSYTFFRSRRDRDRFGRFSASCGGQLPIAPACAFASHRLRRPCERHLRSSAWKLPAALRPTLLPQKTLLRNAARSYRESSSSSALLLQPAKAGCAL